MLAALLAMDTLPGSKRCDAKSHQARL